MARHVISKKEVARLVLKFKNLGIAANLEDKVEVDKRKDGEFYLFKGKPLAFESESFYPSLQILNLFHPERKWITVDDGAVPHLTNGANLFGKGIVELDQSIDAGDIVFIKNSAGVYFAIMKAVKSANEFAEQRSGEFAVMIHRPGDRIYNTFMEISH